MASANHPPQPPTNRAEEGQTVSLSQSPIKATDNVQRTKIQPLWGSLYAVGTKRGARIAKPEFGMSINQFDNHRNRFFDVIERVQWVETDGEIVRRIILDVRGVIVQIVAHEYLPRTVLVWIDGDLRMVKRVALIFILFHLAKRSQA